MTDEERPYGLGLSTTAVEKRRRQIEAWRNSETNLEPGRVAYRCSSKVKFSKGVMLLAAVSNGDEKEVERLLTDENADINYTNSDGMTAVHQCCIDDDIEMLKLLIRFSANINTADNEGWTPLHAAASCGFDHIVRYLLDIGAFPASVNNEGQTASELGEEYPDIVKMIEDEIESQGIDVDEVRCVEEKVMLEDARKLHTNPDVKPVISTGGATPLHVAAAKNYTTVTNVLLSIVGQDIDAKDDDGWTPLHAAVYWGSVETAELLVLSGANMYAKTDAGEEYDDLIDPDLEDEFKRLKKLNKFVNPEPRPRIKHHVCTRQRSFSSSNNQSTDSKGTGITSPGVKRRASKEKINMIDMKKEKEDLMQSFEKVTEDPVAELRDTSGIISPPLAADMTSMQNHVTDTDLPESFHTRTGSITSSGSGSPKNARRKGEMSQKMLERLNKFETPGSNGGGSCSGGVTNSGSTSSPLPSSPRTSTPVSIPPGNVEERKRISSIESFQSSKATSFDSKAQPIKRFSFQPKPVTPKGTGPKSMSLDRGDSSFFKKALDMMSSNDSAKPKFNEQSVKEKASKPEIIPEQSVKPVEQVKPVVSQAVATPTEKTTTSTKDTSYATPTPSTPPNRDLSVDSQSSLLSSKDRSTTFVQAEAIRRTTARRQRESRRSTQPVSKELLQQIKMSDEMEEKELERASPKSPPSETHKDTPIDKPVDTATNESIKLDVTPNTPPSNKQVGGASLEIKDVKEKKKDDLTADGLLQSAYKPASRPVSKLLSDDEIKSVDCNVIISEVLPSSPVATLQQPVPVNPSSLSPSIPPRSRTTKRKKTKEKRRSTGIGEPEENEVIPDNLKGIFHRRQSSGDSTDSINGSNSSTSNALVPDNVQSIDDSALSKTNIEQSQEEIERLTKLLSEEKSVSIRVSQDYNDALLQLKEKDKLITEWQNKYNNTSRAYQEEKEERVKLEKRIQQLEKSDKTINELKGEIQRLKDENGALIRVVGKLSRAPFPS